MNHHIWLKTMKRYIRLLNILFVIILIACIMEKMYGFQNFISHKKDIAINSFVFALTLVIFILITNHLAMIDKRIILNANKSISNINAQGMLEKQMLKIFEALEEAIITTKTQLPDLVTSIQFQNCKFKQILSKMRGVDTTSFLNGENQDQLMNLKIFKVCRYYDDSNNQFEGEDQQDIGTVYSIEQIVNMSESFLNCRIFSIVYDQRRIRSMRHTSVTSSAGAQSQFDYFHFVQLKVR